MKKILLLMMLIFSTFVFGNSEFEKSYGESITNNLKFGMTKQEFEKVIQKKALPESHDEGNYAGIFNLRHTLNEHLRNGAGHIGYGIRREYRGKGYASRGLALVLQEAKKLGIETAYLSTHKDNPASLKVQENNGAFIDHEDENEYYTRIVIC